MIWRLGHKKIIRKGFWVQQMPHTLAYLYTNIDNTITSFNIRNAVQINARTLMVEKYINK